MTHWRAISVLVAAFLVVAGGCSSSIASQKPLTPADAQRVTDAAAGRVVKIEFAERDRSAKAEVREGVLTVQDGSAFGLSRPPESTLRIPFEHTRKVVVSNRGKGFRHGFLVGAIAGACAGLLLGSVVYEAGCADTGGTGSRSNCAIGPMIGGTMGVALVTGLIGGGLGAAIGHRTTFTWP